MEFGTISYDEIADCVSSSSLDELKEIEAEVMHWHNQSYQSKFNTLIALEHIETESLYALFLCYKAI